MYYDESMPHQCPRTGIISPCVIILPRVLLAKLLTPIHSSIHPSALRANPSIYQLRPPPPPPVGAFAPACLFLLGFSTKSISYNQIMFVCYYFRCAKNVVYIFKCSHFLVYYLILYRHKRTTIDRQTFHFGIYLQNNTLGGLGLHRPIKL